MKKQFELEMEWEELIENGRSEGVFGEPLDTELFRECMKDSFAFLCSRERKTAYDEAEVRLYGLLCGYSSIPAVTESEYSEEFEASTRAAGVLAQAIIHPEALRFEGSKMICDFMIDGEFFPAAYDFESGDLEDYIKLVRLHYWD